jgi:carbon-monoxide dehydrogenase medium subunit
VNGFRYVEPTRIADAVALLADPDAEAHLLAGGTALVPMLELGYVQPAMLVGMRRLPGLRAIERRDGTLVIGALVTHAEIAQSALVRDGWPLLAAACGSVGTVRIRNQATLGGNVVHADPNQDPPPALLALEATARLAGPAGERLVPAADLFVDIFQTSLEAGELLLDLTLPAPEPGVRTVYRKFLPRSQDDYATVAVAALARTEPDGRLADVRVALAGVGPRPIRAPEVEATLLGRRPTAGILAEAANLLDVSTSAIDDVRGSAAYKARMARVWVERALGDVCVVSVA